MPMSYPALFRLQTRNHLFFLQNQNISTSAQLKSNNFNETIIASACLFLQSSSENTEAWGDRWRVLYGRLELTDVVDCGSGTRVEMLVMSIKAMRCFHSLTRDLETLLSVAEN